MVSLKDTKVEGINTNINIIQVCSCFRATKLLFTASFWNYFEDYILSDSGFSSLSTRHKNFQITVLGLFFFFFFPPPADSVKEKLTHRAIDPSLLCSDSQVWLTLSPRELWLCHEVFFFLSWFGDATWHLANGSQECCLCRPYVFHYIHLYHKMISFQTQHGETEVEGRREEMTKTVLGSLTKIIYETTWLWGKMTLTKVKKLILDFPKNTSKKLKFKTRHWVNYPNNNWC